MNVIILPVCYLKDVSQGVYATDGRIAISPKEGCDLYSNTPEKRPSNTKSYGDIIFLELGTYTIYTF